MDFIIETGVGLENATSYCSVQFADGYNSGQIDGSDWSDLDLTDKRIALITATQIIDGSFDFFGRRLSRKQALEFPRWGIRDRGGWAMPPSSIPRSLQAATAELARILKQRSDAGQSVSGGTTSTSTTGGVEKIQVGPIALTLASPSTSSSSTTSSGTTAAVIPLIPRSVASLTMDLGIPRFGYGSARLIR